MILNATDLSNLTTAFNAAFNTGFNGVKPQWQNIATLVPSSGKVEQYAWLGQFPKLREWVGDRQMKNLTTHGYSIVNRKFESTIEVSQDDMEDDSVGIYAPLFQEMGYAAAVHPDELVFSLLKTGFETLCYDKKPFFAPDHSVQADGKTIQVSNMQDGDHAPWFLLDTSRPLKPLIFQKRKDYNLQSLTTGEDEGVFMRGAYRYGVAARCNVGFGFWQQAAASKAELTKESFRALRKGMLALKSDEGRPLGITPSLLVVGPSQADAARDVILSERDKEGATNTDRNLVTILEVPFLD